MKVTDFGAEFLQFLVLLPASILCFLPMRNQLKLSAARTFTLLISVLAVVIPVAAVLTISLDVHPNIIFFPLFFVFFLIYYHMVRSGLGETLAILSSDDRIIFVSCGFCACIRCQNPSPGNVI